MHGVARLAIHDWSADAGNDRQDSSQDGFGLLRPMSSPGVGKPGFSSFPGKSMRIPVIKGLIDRRILANFHVDPEVVSRVLPQPFRPTIVNGHAMAGICLIRLKQVRPKFLPVPVGLASENAAHRIAVEWDVDGQVRQGVYIPRRDTSSRLNVLAGGRLFPGVHHRAEFRVLESERHLSVSLQSDDGSTRIRIAGAVSDRLPPSSVFADLNEASEFFARGSLGYSATGLEGRYDGLELRCENWAVKALEVEQIESSFFDDETRFPRNSIGFDCALLMRGIQHEWHGREELCCRTVGR